jgi:hypothetical protein
MVAAAAATPAASATGVAAPPRRGPASPPRRRRAPLKAAVLGTGEGRMVWIDVRVAARAQRGPGLWQARARCQGEWGERQGRPGGGACGGGG